MTSRTGPKYIRVAEDIRKRVEGGDFLPGQSLPTERDFVEHFGVSRVTVRRALRELVDADLLESRQGSGYVVQPRVNQPLNRVTGFSEDCRSRGIEPGSVLLEQGVGGSDAEESAHFGIRPGTRVMRFRRVRTGDGEPMALDHTTLLPSCMPDWPWPEDSLYLAMESAGFLPVRVRQRYLPVLADAALAEYLGVATGAPLMHVIRAGYALGDVPVEYARCWFRPDRLTFTHEVTR